MSGGGLLAAGLLGSWVQVAHRSYSFYGSHPHMAIGFIEDRLRATIGLASLVAGFFLQSVAYMLTVSHDDPSRGTTWAALISLALPIAIALGVYRWLRPRYLMRGCVLVARAKMGEGGETWLDRLPSAHRLATLGGAMGIGRQSEESEDAYARRVFKLGETRV